MIRGAPGRSGPGLGAVLAGVLMGALLGAGGGFAAGLFAFPLLFPPPPAGGQTPLEPGPVRATGGFVQVDPKDPTRWGTGTVALSDRELRLGDDFEVGPGPKYHLYLVPERGLDRDTRVEETMFVDLGPLQAFAGGQGYVLPAGLRPDDYGSVAVWCEQLNVLISAAELRAGAPP